MVIVVSVLDHSLLRANAPYQASVSPVLLHIPLGLPCTCLQSECGHDIGGVGNFSNPEITLGVVVGQPPVDKGDGRVMM